MSKARKPRVIVKCVANAYALDNERIIEIGAGNKGCGALISIRILEDGDSMQVSIYQRTRVEVVS